MKTITIKDQCTSQAAYLQGDEINILHDDIGNVAELLEGIWEDDGDQEIIDTILERINDNAEDLSIEITTS